jgi:predicted nucleic acid-binding protein
MTSRFAERGLIDTSVAIALETGRALDREAIPNDVAVSVITVGELQAGVLAATDVETRARRLTTLNWALELRPIPIDAAVALQWARLRVLLEGLGRRMPVNDSWIAATAMALGVPVVTQDGDYPQVAGLEVIRV